MSTPTSEVHGVECDIRSLAGRAVGQQFGRSGWQDVGGTKGEAGGRGTFTIHGARTGDSQIFIDGKSIGGSDDLHALDAAGKLDGMLK